VPTNTKCQPKRQPNCWHEFAPIAVQIHAEFALFSLQIHANKRETPAETPAKKACRNTKSPNA
jgi:hypothetical protein